MSLLSRIASLFRNLTRRRDVERDLAAEVNSYVDLATQQKVRNGVSEPEARRQALVEFGGAEQVKELVRDARLGRFFETRMQDVRYAFRSLRKAPVFSLTVAMVLGLGIGSTALMFTIVNSVLLKGPPFPEADRLVMLWQDLPQEKLVSLSTREFTIWREQSQLFENMAAMTGSGFTITGRGAPELVLGQQVTPSFFPTLRLKLALGRAFLEAEGKAGQDRVVILSHAFWRDKFGLQPDVLGQSVTMNGKAYTVVGVLPENFDFPSPQYKVWVPAALDAPLFQENLDAHFLRVIGRLKPGVTPERLKAEIDILGRRVNPTGDDTVRRFYSMSLAERMFGDLRQPLLVLFSAVAFLLLIACANVANLMLARASSRQSEMAIRAAMGASRPRLIAQLLTEAALLAVIGGALGIGIATWGLDALRAFAAENVQELLHAHIDGWALAFVLFVSALSGILFGLGPAFAASRTDLQEALKGTARSSTSAAAERTRRLLVFAEVALACVLLVGCALMMRSFAALVHADPGFRPQNVVVADAVLMQDRYPDAASMIRYYRDTLAAVRALPGVVSAGVVTHLPFGGNTWGNSYEVEGQPAAPGVQYNAQIRPVSPGYFATLQIPLKQGRDFTERDNETVPGVTIVNEAFVERFWPNESPLGKRIRYGKDWISIVGVCGSIKHNGLDIAPDAEIYVSYPQTSPGALTFVGRQLNFVVRSPANVAAVLRATISSRDPNLVIRINTMEALINDSVAQPRFRTWLIGVFSIFALTLACLGIYGVIAYLVTQRYKEIGIRMALGATRANILQLVLARTFKLTALGIVAGLILAFFLARFLNSILFGITAHDTVTFAVVPLCLVAIALLAGYLPARRATRVDPVSSLRYE
ncbi:MAG TPA: ABC transporter permease [Chthoniobacterales bacterium]|nr:ABC transporter permease [Chthoniobacterales bacterium]